MAVRQAHALSPSASTTHSAASFGVLSIAQSSPPSTTPPTTPGPPISPLVLSHRFSTLSSTMVASFASTRVAFLSGPTQIALITTTTSPTRRRRLTPTSLLPPLLPNKTSILLYIYFSFLFFLNFVFFRLLHCLVFYIYSSFYIFFSLSIPPHTINTDFIKYTYFTIFHLFMDKPL